MKFTRFFTKPNIPVADQIKWKTVEASIPGAGFHMPTVEVPAQWSETATNIFAQKYLRKAGVPNTTARTSKHEIGDASQPPGWLLPRIPEYNATFGPETSAKKVFHRLAGCWT